MEIVTYKDVRDFDKDFSWDNGDSISQDKA